jgi:hypothetical protein
VIVNVRKQEIRANVVAFLFEKNSKISPRANGKKTWTVNKRFEIQAWEIRSVLEPSDGLFNAGRQGLAYLPQALKVTR